MENLLVVDDDAAVLRSMQRLLAGAGYGVDIVDNLRDARTRLRTTTRPYDAILLDIYLNGERGEELLADVVKLPNPPPVIAVSAQADAELTVALRTRCVALLPKPVTQGALEALFAQLPVQPKGSVRSFCEHHKLSPQQSNLVALAARGVDNPQIAERLGCSMGTLRRYWRRVQEKTGLASKSEIVEAARTYSDED